MAKIIIWRTIPYIFIVLVFILVTGCLDARRRNGACPWVNYKNTTCHKTNFLCSNKKCIKRKLYCNGVNDCGDNSDEYMCKAIFDYYRSSKCNNKYRECGDRCVPESWFCDGVPDCPNGTDEGQCENFEYKDEIFGNGYAAMLKSLRWLYQQRETEPATEIGGTLADKSAVALYLANPNFEDTFNRNRKDITNEISVQLLSRIYRKKLKHISSTDLASFVNVFLVTSLDPRNFHGVNIIQELRDRVDKQNYTNPYVFLALCNAGETITESDKLDLLDTFWNKRRTFWTDMQAVVIMALACASKQPNNDLDIDRELLRELTMELKPHQSRNGKVENLQTTALVMQALLSAEPDDDPDNFDEEKALQYIIENQKPDGSFGNVINTYFVLPVLNCKSLINISLNYCKSMRGDEISALANLVNQGGPKIRVEYSLWIGKDKDLERNLALRVPVNLSFYGIMEIAAEIDSRYSFEYLVENRKPYVNAISGFQDNPEKGKFWFLYIVKDGQPSPAQESPADVIPKDNDHFIMWYRSGSWAD